MVHDERTESRVAAVAMRYEYALISTGNADSDERVLNHYARDGWQVVGVVSVNEGTPQWTLERAVLPDAECREGEKA